MGVLMVSLGEPWVQLNGAFEFPLSAGPVPFVLHLNEGQRSMGFGEVVIKLQSFRRCCLCPFVGLFSRKSAQKSELEQIHIRVGQSRISQSIAGVLVDCLVETLDALFQSFLCSLAQEIAN